MIIFESEKVKVEFNEAIPAIVWTPCEFMSSEEFRASFLLGMDVYVQKMKELPSLGWLNDARKLRAPRIDDVKWLDQNVNERAYSVGGKKVAFVLPDDNFAKLGIRTYCFFTSKRADNTLDIKAFKTIQEAKSWLKGDQKANFDEIRLSINQKNPNENLTLS